METIYFLLCTFALYILVRYLYHTYSLNYVMKLLGRIREMECTLSKEEEEWIRARIEYLMYISADKYLCDKSKVKSRFLRELEFATFTGLFSGDSYNEVYKAINF